MASQYVRQEYSLLRQICKWTKVELSICKELDKNILLLIFDKNEERVEKLKKDFSLDDSPIVLMNSIEVDYETVRKKLLKNNFI